METKDRFDSGYWQILNILSHERARKIGRDIVGRRGLLRATPMLRYMEGVVDYIRDPSGRRLPCSAGSGSFFLDPRGNVYP